MYIEKKKEWTIPPDASILECAIKKKSGEKYFFYFKKRDNRAKLRSYVIGKHVRSSFVVARYRSKW